MAETKLDYTNQDRLWEGRFRMRDGSYRKIDGLRVQLWNDASCGTALVTGEQDNLRLGKIRAERGRWGAEYYSVWNKSMVDSGEAGILSVID